MGEGLKYMNSVSCMVVFEALRLQAGLQELIDSVLETLKAKSQASHGRFIAVDLRAEMLGTKSCQVTTAGEKKSCFSAMEVGQFLNKMGFERNTPIYLTEIGWHKSLHALKSIFPSTFTKVRLHVSCWPSLSDANLLCPNLNYVLNWKIIKLLGHKDIGLLFPFAS